MSLRQLTAAFQGFVALSSWGPWDLPTAVPREVRGARADCDCCVRGKRQAGSRQTGIHSPAALCWPMTSDEPVAPPEGVSCNPTKPLCGEPCHTRLDLHGLGLDDVHLVLVAAPDAVVHDGHAADGVVRVAQVHQVVVAQVPLAVCREPTSPAQAWLGCLCSRGGSHPKGMSGPPHPQTRSHLHPGGRWPVSRQPEPRARAPSRACDGRAGGR